MTGMEDGRFRPEGQDDLAPSGSVARVLANLAAIRLVRTLQAEQRPATRDEQQVLARWSGWGAVPAVFDEREVVDGRPGPGVAFQWARDELRQLLTDGEYRAARTNTINAHFTDAGLVEAIWTGMDRLGFVGGRVLEPGCGSGNFIGLAPPTASMVGVEVDPTTAAIAAALYPHARVLEESFAATQMAPASFAAAVGNVPFGSLRLRDPKYNPGRRLPIHTHFIAKALDFVQPGGMLALITSRYTMDAVEDAAVQARARLAAKADLVAAIRLPDTAHRRAAGTTVVTDLLILRRREPDRAPDPVAWMNAPIRNVGGEEVAINEYFDAHPEMILGDLAVSGRREGDLRVRGAADAAPALAEALDRVADDARKRGLLMAAPLEPQSEAGPLVPVTPGAAAAPQLIEGFITAHDDGTFTQVQDGVVQPYEPPRMSDKEAQELRELCGLRDVRTALMDAERRDDTAAMDRLRAELNDRYDRYVAQYGPINRVSTHARIKDTPTGRALRARLLSEGKARIVGGTITPVGADEQSTELRERLLAERLAAEVTPGGPLRMARSAAARAERERLIAAGLIEVHGGKLELTEEGLAEALEADDDAVVITKRRPRQGGFRTDPFAVRVQALERYSAPTRTATKTDIFRKPINPVRSVPRTADSPADALAICMDQHAQVRLDVIASLLGTDEATAREQLGQQVFYDPEQERLVPAAEYLSGDVRAKLRLATAAAIDDPALQVNVEALTKVIPEDLGPAEIEIRLGSVVVDVEDVQQFLRETLEDPTVRVELRRNGEWKVRGGRTGVLATSTWGTEQAPATWLAQHLLNQSPIRITKKTIDDKIVLDEEATEAAQDKAEELNERFGAWVWEDLDRAERLTRTYNDRFNAIVLRSYDDVELSTPGLNRDIRLHWWQKAAVARMINEEAVGLFHDMGAGKTLEAIVGVMELRRLGLVRKPVICVKNHMLEQVRDEFMWAYPEARVLCADSEELTGEGKRRFLQRCMNEEVDAVILTRGAFASINLSPEGHRAYLDYAEELFSAHLDEGAGSVKDDESSLVNFRNKIEAIIEGDDDEGEDDENSGTSKKKRKRPGIDKDPALTWEGAGFDYVVVDESQDYNNLWTPSNVAGQDIGFVRMCVDLEMKLHSMRQRFGNRVVTFATGTPVTNKIIQFYVMQRYLRPDRLKAAGFYSADSWLATFATQTTKLEMKGDNTYGPVTRTDELINIPEMLLEIHQFGDFKSADDIDLPRPAIRGGKPEVLLVPASPELTEYQSQLSRRYAAARRNRGRKGEDTVVACIGDGFRAGQDLRLVSDPNHGPAPEMTDHPQKVDVLAADILREWKLHRDDVYLDADGNPDPVRGSLFMVFCNEGVPSAGWNLYDELRDLLVKGGMPRRAIRFIHEATDRRKKSALMAECNDGHVAVLIGSTEKMGVGTNAQRRAVGAYHVHPHWRPDYDDQEDARLRRPGNQNSEIFIKKLITEQSYDIIRAQRCEQKAGFLSVLKRRDPTVRTYKVPDDDTMSYAEVAALGAGDLRLIEKNALNAELKKLVRAQRNHSRQQTHLKMKIRQAEQGIRQAKNALTSIEQALPRRVDTAGEKFIMTIDGTRHTKRAEAAEHLKAVLLRHWDSTVPGVPRIVTIGHLGGFEIQADLRRDRRPNTVMVNLQGVYDSDIYFPHNKIPSGIGLVSRLENRLADLDRHQAELIARIPALEREIERATPAIGQPFPQADQLQRTRERIKQLDQALAEGKSPPAAPDTDENLIGELVDRTVDRILQGQDKQVADPALTSNSPTEAASDAHQEDARQEDVAAAEVHDDATKPAEPSPEQTAESSALTGHQAASETDDAAEPDAPPYPAADAPSDMPGDDAVPAAPAPADPALPPGMTIQRRDELIEAMTMLAPAYARAGAGDPARYAVEAIDATLAPTDTPVTREEWDWAEAWAQQHPEIADGSLSAASDFWEHRRRRIRRIAEDRRRDIKRISTQARLRWQAGDLDGALQLIGEGERLYPEDGTWARARTFMADTPLPAPAGTSPETPGSSPTTVEVAESPAAASTASSSAPEIESVQESAETSTRPAHEPGGATPEPAQQAMPPEIEGQHEQTPPQPAEPPALAGDADTQVDGGPMPEQSPAVAEPATGPVSARIHIDDSVARPTVSGTRYEDTELRAALRANNFRWRGKRTLWEYVGRAADRDTAVAAIRSQVAELDRAAIEQKAAKPSFPPTAQQQAIIDAAVAGQNVAVQALAGTGKTSTLRMVAEAMPDRRILYIAFNKTIAEEARQSMSANVTALTFNAYALRQMRGGPYAAKLDRLGKGARHPQDIARLLNVEPVEYLDHEGEPQVMAAGGRVQLAKAVVAKFRMSSDPKISEAHLPDALPSTMVYTPILETARQIWENIADPNNAHLLDGDRAVQFDHDDYFKLWALTRPRIDTDVIFFDEAQDINDVQRDVVQSQPAQTLVVGDTYQSIYGFRGAKDALKDWPADITLPLTQSWRFGPAIAERGDDFLRLLGAPFELTGNPAMNSRIGVVDHPDAILCRTNVGAVSEVSRAVDEGKKVALVGGSSEISKLAIAAKDLKAGRGTNHPELSRFTHWWEVEEAAQEERALQPFVRLIDQHGPDKLLNLVGNLVDEDAIGDSAPDVVVSTAHKAKGREWRRVRIAGDFHTPKYAESGEIESLPSAEELRLSYVAVTRGRDEVSLGSLEWIEDAAVTAAPVRDQQHPDLSVLSETAETQSAPEPGPAEGPERQPSAVDEPATTTADSNDAPAAAPAAANAQTREPEPAAREQEEPESPEPAAVDVQAGQDPSTVEGDADGQGELLSIDDILVLDDAPSPGQSEEPEQLPAQEAVPVASSTQQTDQEQPVPSTDQLVWTRDGDPADRTFAPAGDDAMLDEVLREVTEVLAEQAEEASTTPATDPDPVPAVAEPPVEPAPEPASADDQATDPGDVWAEDMPDEDVPDPQPAPFSRYPDVQEAVERLKLALAERADAGPARDAAPLPPPAAADDTEPSLTGVEDVLAGPLAEAQNHLATHTQAPEWRRVAEVANASRLLGRTIVGAVGSYRREVANDIRVRGLWRAVSARCARVIAASANALANRLDRGAALAIKALRRLGRAANDYADQLQGNLPSGRTLQTTASLQQSLDELDAMLDQPAPPVSTPPAGAVLLENSMNALHQAFTGARAAVQSAGAAVTSSPAWQRLTNLWNGAASVVDRVRQGALRFERDAFAMGFLRAVWTRTCETLSWGARQAMEHMADNGGRLGPAWQALRLLHHTAEETIAHLREQLPRDQHAPLGTYDPPSIAEAAARALREAPTPQTSPAAPTVPAPRPEAEQGPQYPADQMTVIQEMIEVLDAIDLARQHNGELDGGFGAVATRTEQAAERMGLRRIGQVGDAFDPRVHEGVGGATPDHQAPDKPVAVQILRPGYMVGDSLIRPASVRVGSRGDLDPEVQQARELMVMSRQGTLRPKTTESETTMATVPKGPSSSHRRPGLRTGSSEIEP